MKKIQIMKNLKQKRFKNRQSKILDSRFKLKQLKKNLPRIKSSRLKSRLKKKKIKQLRPGLSVPVLRFFNKKKLVSKGFLKSVASLPLFKKTSVYWKKKLNNFSKFFFYLSIKALVSVQAYKLFILMELQLNIVLSKAQLVPFFFLVTDLCFYRLVFVNQVIITNPHYILSLYDAVQLPLFVYHIMNYRQNRFYFYPWFLKYFFKVYWGQFIDYNKDKIWLLSNYLLNVSTGELLVHNYPTLFFYMAPFRRFTKLYYKAHPERLRREDAGLSYSYSIFKLHLFNYANFYA